MQGKLPLLGGGTTTDESVLPSMGDEALGVITALHYSPALDTAGQPEVRARPSRPRPARSPSYYSEATYTGMRWIVEAVKAIGGKVEDREALLAALRKVEIKDAAARADHVDAYGNPIQNIYVRKVERMGGQLQNTVIPPSRR